MSVECAEAAVPGHHIALWENLGHRADIYFLSEKSSFVWRFCRVITMHYRNPGGCHHYVLSKVTHCALSVPCDFEYRPLIGQIRDYWPLIGWGRVCKTALRNSSASWNLGAERNAEREEWCEHFIMSIFILHILSDQKYFVLFPKETFWTSMGHLSL